MAVKISRDQWAREAQAGELAWHRKDDFRADDLKWWKHTDLLMRSFGLRPHDYAGGGQILDVGAGSRMRGLFFQDARVSVIEPLADEYRTLPHCDLDRAEHVWAVPAEEQVPEAVDRFDLVYSINVLDHCFDPAAVIANMAAYKAPGGRVLIAVDCRDRATKLHPIRLTPDDLRDMIDAAGLEVLEWDEERAPFGSSRRAVATWCH